MARQYSGQFDKQDSCQVAVSLSVANSSASLPVAWRLYLLKSWAADENLRLGAGVQDGGGFQIKLAITLG